MLSIPNTLNIFINTRIRGHSKFNYEPDMSVPNITSENVFFNPLIKLDSNIVNKIPRGYPTTERYTQFFNKNEFTSLENRTISSTPQYKINLEDADKKGIISNNIRITLNTLFKPNSILYIHGQPYTVYNYEWINADWKIDKKKIEKKIKQSQSQSGLSEMQYIKSQELEADKELLEFKLQHPTINKFIKDEEKEKEKEKERKKDEIENVKNFLHVVATTVPKAVQNLIGRDLITEDIINISNDTNLSSDPLSLTIIYINDKTYSEDIKLDSNVLTPLYNNLLKKGEALKKAKEKYETSFGIPPVVPVVPVSNVPVVPVSNVPVSNVPVSNSNRNTGATGATGATGPGSNAAVPTAVVPTAAVPTAVVPTAFNQKFEFDKTTDSIYNFLYKKENIIKEELINLIETQNNYKKLFLEFYINSMKLLIDKVNKQLDYFEALILFYSNLLRVRKKNIKKQTYLNILADKLIYFDITCYTNLLKDKTFNHEFNYLKSIVEPAAKLFVSKYNNTNVNYNDQLKLYYKYPHLLKIDKYQLDIYISHFLKFDKLIENSMWIVLYKQTNVFFENFKNIIFDNIKDSKNILQKYNEKYSEYERQNFAILYAKTKKPLQKQTLLGFESTETPAFKLHKKDYINLQNSIISSYDYITIYCRISLILCAREISEITSSQNYYQTELKILDRYGDYYEQILKDDDIKNLNIPISIFWDTTNYTEEKINTLNNNNNTEILSQNLKLNYIKNKLDNLSKKYTDIIDLLIPQISDMGIYQQCENIIKEELKEELKKKYINQYNIDDTPTTKTLQYKIEQLYNNCIENELIQIPIPIPISEEINKWIVVSDSGSFFTLIALAFNTELITHNNISINPFSDSGFFTVLSLRKAVNENSANQDLGNELTIKIIERIFKVKIIVIKLDDTNDTNITPIINNTELDKADYYLFLLTRKGKDYELITYDFKTMFTFEQIPEYMKCFIFIYEWSIFSSEDRKKKWVYHNKEFREYLIKKEKEYLLFLQSFDSALLFPPKARSLQGKQKQDGGSNKESKLNFNVVIDLELYPGTSIPLNKRAVLGCQLQYEKIRRAYADMFGIMYQPAEFYTNQDDKQRKQDKNNTHKYRHKQQHNKTMRR